MDRTLLRITCTLALLLGASGCALTSGNSGTNVHVVDRNGIDMIAAPAGHVSVLIKDKESKERTCGGRMPDAIMDSSVGLNLGKKGLGVGTNNTDMGLGGRSPAVLIVREVFFRLCEIVINADLDAKAIVELYKDSLPMVFAALKSPVGGTSAIAVDGTSVVGAATPPSPTNSPYGSSSPSQYLGGYEQQTLQPSATDLSGTPLSGSTFNTGSNFVMPSGNNTWSGGATSIDPSGMNSLPNGSSQNTNPADGGGAAALNPTSPITTDNSNPLQIPVAGASGDAANASSEQKTIDSAR